MEINNTREALVRMAEVTSELLARVAARVAAAEGYTDSDYDVLENYLMVTANLLAADYEGNENYLPHREEAPWCPDEVRAFLPS